MSINFAYPLLMDWHQSGDFVMMTILGGAGTLWGPFIGAIIYTLAANVLSSKTETWQIIIGALFVVCVLFFPKGILGLFSRPSTTSEDVDAAPNSSALRTSAGARGARMTAAASGATMLHAEKVSLSFGGVHAVVEVDIDVHEREIFAIIGPNGAGKTSFFNALTGYFFPDAGRVSFLGKDITRTPNYARIARGMSRTFQTPSIFPELTVYENVVLGVHSKMAIAGSLRGLGARKERGRRACRRATGLRQSAALEGYASRVALARQPASGRDRCMPFRRSEARASRRTDCGFSGSGYRVA